MQNQTILLLTVLLSILSASAQPTPAQRPQRPQNQGVAGPAGGQATPRPGGQPPAAANQPAPPARGPAMTEEQQRAMRAMSEKIRTESTPHYEKLNEARRQLNEAIYADKLDEAAVREKAMAVSKIEADLAIVRAKVFSEMRASLPPEQVERMKRGGAQFGPGGMGPQVRPVPAGAGGGPPGAGGGQQPPRPQPGGPPSPAKN